MGSTCLILCRSPLCCWNSSNPSRRHKTSESVQWHMFAAHASSPVNCELWPPGVWHIPQMLEQTEIWGMRRPSGRLKLFVMSLKPFLDYFCSVAGHNALQKEGVELSLSGVLSQCNTHMNARNFLQCILVSSLPRVTFKPFSPGPIKFLQSSSHAHILGAFEGGQRSTWQQLVLQ